MNDQTDQQLLRNYADLRSEAAFAALVQRHVDLVYSAAFRMVCDAHAAKDVTQRVFVLLAQNAPQLIDRPALAGWLHGTARNLAVKTVRSDVRRRAREHEAAVMNELLSPSPDAGWEHIAPKLDEALEELETIDREAVLLRYFKNHDLRTVGATLGISDDAAQKRISRAVERLRKFFAKRGITVGASGLAVVLSANAVQAAPVGLAVAISTSAALTGTTLATATTVTATQAIAMTALQKTIVGATIAVLVGTGIYEARRASHWRDKVQTLQQERAPLDELIQQLRGERDEAAREMAGLREDNERLNRNTAELLKLRGEIAHLRESAQELAQLKAAGASVTKDSNMDATIRSLSTRVTRLRQGVEQMPDKRIPDLQLLADQDWLDAVRDLKMETDDDIRRALSNLRSNAKRNFGNLLRKALAQYAAAHDDWLPADLSQLKPYLGVAVDDAVLLRYQLAQTGKLSDVAPKNPVVIEKAPPVDDEYDTVHLIGMNGITVNNVDRFGDRLLLAMEEFARANNGLLPHSPSQLTPYLKQPRDLAKAQEVLSAIPSEVTTLEQLKNRKR